MAEETNAANRIAVEMGDGRVVRLSLSVLTMRDWGRYNVLRREGIEWLEAQGFSAKPSAGEDETTLELRLLCVARAQMLAALVQVEASEDGGLTWEPSTLPEAWQTLDGFFGIPAELYQLWYAAALALNPGVFLGTAGSAEKNAGAAIVVSLKSA